MFVKNLLLIAIFFVDFGNPNISILWHENLDSSMDGAESQGSEERATKCPWRNVSVRIRRLVPEIIVKGSKMLLAVI